MIYNNLHFQLLEFNITNQSKIVNLEICDENAIHSRANQLQPIPAMVAAGTYPEWNKITEGTKKNELQTPPLSTQEGRVKSEWTYIL